MSSPETSEQARLRAQPWGAHIRGAPKSVRAKETRPGQEHLIDRVYGGPSRELVSRRGNAAAPAVLASQALELSEEEVLTPPRLTPTRPVVPPAARTTATTSRRRLSLLAPLAAALAASAAVFVVFVADGDQLAPRAAPLAQAPEASGEIGDTPTPSVNPLSLAGFLADEAVRRAAEIGVLGQRGGSQGGSNGGSNGSSSVEGGSIDVFGTGFGLTPAGPYSGNAVPAASCTLKTPWLVGWQLNAALRRLENRGLSAQQANHPEDNQRFRERWGNPLWVVSQAPRPDQRVACGSTVAFRVSYNRPRLTIPGVVGMKYAAAKFQVERRGFDAVKGYRRSNKPRNTVVAQSPGGGDAARAGAQVFLYSSSGAAGRDYTPPGDRDNDVEVGDGDGGAKNPGSEPPTSATDAPAAGTSSGENPTSPTSPTTPHLPDLPAPTVPTVPSTPSVPTTPTAPSLPLPTPPVTTTVTETTGTISDTVGNTLPSIGGAWGRANIFELAWLPRLTWL